MLKKFTEVCSRGPIWNSAALVTFIWITQLEWCLYVFIVPGRWGSDFKWHDDVIKWKHFPRYWPFVRSPVNSPHNGQWRGALVFPFICAWINGWVNNRKAGDLRRHRGHYDFTVMSNFETSFSESYLQYCVSSEYCHQVKAIGPNGW